jgi:prophage antirepressor-like protein
MKNQITIKTFENGQFGHLTCLKSEATGKIMFIAKEVCDLWGHKNSTQAIKDAKLDSNETLVLKRNQHLEFFSFVTKQNLVTNKTHSIQLVTESGLYKLALNSKKAEADKLKHWIANDVLPSLRKTGKFVMASTVNNISDHQSVSIQKGNSKDVNRVNYQNGGRENIIDYNRRSCLAVTNKTPKEIMELGKQLGLKSSERSSSKQVLRHTRPELACTMSFIDDAVKQGQDFDKYAELGRKHATPLFKAMIESGMKPGELSA